MLGVWLFPSGSEKDLAFFFTLEEGHKLGFICLLLLLWLLDIFKTIDRERVEERMMLGKL